MQRNNPFERMNRLFERTRRSMWGGPAGGEWRWRLRHRNGNVIADSGEGYASRHGLHDAIGSVKRDAPGAETEERLE